MEQHPQPPPYSQPPYSQPPYSQPPYPQPPYHQPPYPHPSQPQPQPPQSSTKNFKINYILTLVYAVVILVLTIVWSTQYQGGFGNYNLLRKWNFHHLFMLIGMLIINGNAMLVFRLGKNVSKQTVTAIHILCNVVGFAFAVTGLEMAFSFRRSAWYIQGYDMYSFHSWMGMIAVVFYAAQFIGGFLAHFPNPIVSTDRRRRMASAHKKIGMFVFATSAATALTGLLLRVALTVPTYIYANIEGTIINFIALFILCFSMTLLYLVGYPKYGRKK